MGQTVTTRVSSRLVRELERISREERLDRSAAVRRLLEDAVRQWKIEHALRRYARGEVTLWTAATIADLSLRSMIDEAARRGILVRYSVEDLREDMRALGNAR